MKKEIIKTILLILGLVVWISAFSLIFYTKEVNYSQLAPNQVDNDSTYTLLKTQNSVSPIINYIYVIVIMFLIFLIGKVWFNTAKEYIKKTLI